MIKLTDAQWNKIKDKYIPENLREEIETDNFIASIKGEKTTLKIKIPNVDGGHTWKEVPAEKISAFWYITPNGGRKFSLSHAEGAAIIQGVKSRKALLTLWAKLSVFDLEYPIDELVEKPYYLDLAAAVTEFKNTGK